MKTQNVLLGIVFLLFGSSCKENTILEKKRVYTPVMLYFSTIEDYLMSANDIPDFVNYPNDWVRWGLKGKVKTVTDKTFHQFSLDFYEDGRLQEVNFISSGVGGTKEGQQTLFHYNDSSRLQSVGDYTQRDSMGNWIERTITNQNTNEQRTETRDITYYETK